MLDLRNHVPSNIASRCMELGMRDHPGSSASDEASRQKLVCST